MKKSKLAANIFIGIAVYAVVYLLIALVILGLPILIFGDYLKNNHIASAIFSILSLVSFIIIPFLSHFIYYKILNKYNTKYELSVTLKAVFITFLIFTIIIAIIFFCASGIPGLLIAVIPLLDTISYLNKSNKYEMLIHNEKVEQLWANLKPEITEKMFKKGTVQVSNIIVSLAKTLTINLNNCEVDEYRKLLKIYGEVFVWKTEKKASYESILLSLQKYNKDYIDSEEIAKKVFDFCVSDIYITDYKSKADETTQNPNEAQNLKNNKFNFCNICGNKLDNDYTFCNKCGNKVR